MKKMRVEVQKLAKNASILIVDDSKVSLEMYRLMLDELFLNTYTAVNGKEAYDLWMEKEKNIDIILTDMVMPVMDGNELISKIRKESNSQRIMVLSGLENLNEMRDIIDHGVDGIMLKPFKEEKVFPILLRVLSMVKAKKILKQQYIQLRVLSKENVSLKNDAIKIQEIPLSEEVTSKAEDKSKYAIRKSFIKDQEKTEDFFESLDYENIDDADKLQYELEDMEAKLFHLKKSDNLEDIRLVILESTNIFIALKIFMEKLHSFEVASDASSNLVEYIENLDFSVMEDESKRSLFLEVYISMFEDIYKWIKIVFVDNDKENINYFDASFANSCLELEAVFSGNMIEEDDCELEFF